MPAEAAVESRRRPAEPEPAPSEPRREKCPRCESRDTKFCYYNNYNTSQPRHFCRSCRRYWTLGGSLRNVPIGGSSRNPHAPNLNPTPTNPNKRLRTAHHHLDPAPIQARHVSPLLHHSLVGPAGFQLALGEPFRFQLGLGLGPMDLLWAPDDTWRMEAAAAAAGGGGGGGVGDCFGIPAAEVGGGPEGDRVR